MIKITHSCGFFSCCSVKLHSIVDFINANKKLPDCVDSSEQFKWYKNDSNKDNDITFHYFENYNNITDVDIIHPINYYESHQFTNYNNLNYANQVLTKNPKILFLIQSDETQFIEYMTNHFPNNSFYFKDEIRHMNKCISTVDMIMSSKNYEFSKKYLAITIIMSKCNYIICGSGNCDIWIMLYRGNNNNVIQNLTGSWYNCIF